MATASGEVGADPPIGHCARLRRELSGEPDAGNPHLRFDEGRVRRSHRLSLTLLLYRLGLRYAARLFCYARSLRQTSGMPASASIRNVPGSGAA